MYTLNISIYLLPNACSIERGRAIMQWLTYFSAWFQVSIAVFITIGGFIAYQQPQFHNTRTMLALIVLVFLTLTELFLVFAQAYSIIPTRPLSPLLLTTIYGCCVFVGASEFLFRKLNGRGWNITRVCIAILYIAFTIIVIGYIYNL